MASVDMLKSPNVILLTIVLILFGPVIFLNATFAPPKSTSFGITDFVEEVMTPQGDVQPRNLPLFYTADPLGVRHSYGLDPWVLGSLAKFEIPFWNPYQLTGQPLLGAFWYAPLYPGNWLRLYLPETSWDWYYYAHVLLFAFFAYRTALVVSRSAFASVCAGLAAITLGAVTNYLPMQEMTTAMPWGAGVIFSFIKISAGIFGRRHLILAMVSTAFFGLSGHPTVAVFWLFGFVIFCVIFFLVSKNNPPKPLLAFLVSACFGAILAAPSIGPFLEYMAQPDTLTIFSQPHFFNFRDFIVINFPNVLGRLNHIDGRLPGYAPGHLALIPVFLVPLLIGLRAAFVQRHPVIMAMSVSAGILAAWSFGIYPFAYLSELPFLRRLTFVYGWIVIGFYLAVICSFGIKELQNLDRRRRTAAVVKCLIFYVMLLVLASGYVVASDAEAGRLLEENLLSILLVLAQVFVFWIIVGVVIDTARTESSVLSVTEALAIFAIACFAVIYMPSGNPEAVTWIQWAMLGAVTVVIALAYIARNAGDKAGSLVGVAFIIVFSTHLIVFTHFPGLPGRWGKPETPEYLSGMTDELKNYRFYGVEGGLPLNNLGRFGVSSMNNLSVLTPSGVDAFYRTYLDKYAPTAQFYGHAFYPTEGPGAISEYIANRRFWEYLGVRYLALPLAWPLIYAKDTDAHPVYSALSTAGDLENAGNIVLASLNKVDPRLKLTHLDSSIHRPVPFPARQPAIIGEVPCSELSAESSVFVKISTYGLPVTGNLELRLTRGKEIISTQSVEKGQVRDNQFVEIKLTDSACKNDSDEMIGMVLKYMSSPEQALALWLSEDGYVDWYIARKVEEYDFKLNDAIALAKKFGVTGRLDCSIPIEVVSMAFGKYGQQGEGEMLVVLWPENNESHGEIFRREVTSLRESAYAHFRPRKDICGGIAEYLNVGVMHLASYDSDPVAVSRRAGSGRLALVGHYVDHQQNLEDFRLVAKDFEGQIAIIENLRAEPRAYFTHSYRQAADVEAARADFASLDNLRSVAVGEPGGDYCPSSSDSADTETRDGGDDAVTITRISPQKLELDVEATGPGTLVVTDTFYPGWSASIDGAHAAVQRVNGYFLGVCIREGGFHKVELEFRPTHWLLFVSFSMISALLFLFFLFYARARWLSKDGSESRAASDPDL